MERNSIMMFEGIGYQDMRSKVFNESGLVNRTDIEKEGNEKFVIYFGRAVVDDFETGVTARGQLKIGRGKFITAIQRGRNQPGIDFRIYAEIVVGKNSDTYVLERLIKKTFLERNLIGSQGQRETYSFTDDEIADVVYTIEEMTKDFYPDVEIKKVNFYQ
jgi:hypothetical protein